MQALGRILKKWLEAPYARKSLDILLENCPQHDQPLGRRMAWLNELLHWIRSSGRLGKELDFQSGAPQATRVRYLLMALDRNPAWKTRVAHLLRSIFKDTSCVELFATAGLAHEEGFFSEAIDRFNALILPSAADDADLGHFFSESFSQQSDVGWITQIDAKTFAQLGALIESERGTDEPAWNHWMADAEKAVQLVAIQTRALGLSQRIRSRLTGFSSKADFRDLPFYSLCLLTDRMTETTDPKLRQELLVQIEFKIGECQQCIKEVLAHLDEYGVDLATVYHLDRLESLLGRLRSLCTLVLGGARESAAVLGFIAELVSENVKRRTISALFSENLSLISRKIVDRSAETGEHYIARDWKEFLHMFRNALGGGAVTAITTFIKFAMSSMSLPGFVGGFLSSINYSLSFLVIQGFGFTLATKQPAMTGPALAAQLPKIRNDAGLEKLVDEIAHLIRSQMAAVMGNVMAVVPATALASWIYLANSARPLLSEKIANYTIHSFSLLGPTPFYAAFTGVLLWLSSIMSGWADNWFARHRLLPALSRHPRLRYVLGEAGARHAALLMKGSVSGAAGSVSLGFLLGMTPPICAFLGLPLDVRHVTLSSGSLTVAAFSSGPGLARTWDFWLAVAGIASMAVLNLGVSFALAFFVAVRARRTQAIDRGRIYRAVLKRFLSKPLSFFFPPRTSNPS